MTRAAGGSAENGPVAPPDEDVGAALARLYDVDLIDDPGDVDLYLALAARTGGPILEVAVGSGRIAAELAAAGHDVTGVDLDPAMLQRARRRGVASEEAASRNCGSLNLIEADARNLPDDIGTFRLAFIALNSLLILGARKSQASAIRQLANHLEPGGLAVIDVWLPHAEDLARYDGRLGLEYVREDPESGLTVTKLASARHDATTGAVELTVIYDEGRQGTPTRRWIRHDVLRLVGPDDLRAFAEAAGLEVEVIAGDYDLDPIGAGDDRAILVARRPLAAEIPPRRRTGNVCGHGSGGRSGRRSDGSGLV